MTSPTAGGLAEDTAERKMFDDTAALAGGEIQAVAYALSIWSTMAPPHGSFGKQCAIMSNACRRATASPVAAAPPAEKILAVGCDGLASESPTRASLSASGAFDLLREALEIGLDLAKAEAADKHELYGGYPLDGLGRKFQRADDDVAKIEAALAALAAPPADAERIAELEWRYEVAQQDPNYEVACARVFNDAIALLRSAQPPAATPGAEPSDRAVIYGFESVSDFRDSELNKLLSGCRASALSARICWRAMNECRHVEEAEWWRMLTADDRRYSGLAVATP